MKEWVKKAISILDSNLLPIRNEPNELDWKEDLSPNKKRLKEHISAFANYPGGGFLIFGVNDKTGKIDGITSTEAKLISSQLTSLARDGVEPGIAIEHDIEMYQDHPILICRIPESLIKPVVIRGCSFDETFVRSGGSTRKAKRHEIGALLMNSRNPRFELLHATELLHEDSVLSLLDYDSVYKLLGKPKPDTKKELLNQLIQEKLIEYYPSGGYYITNLGALVAAKRLNEFPDLERKNIRVVIYKGLNKVETDKEVAGNKGYAIGFSGLIKYLKIILPQNEIIMDALRKETSLYPEIALRELIANAIIHQDFNITGAGPIIEIFENRITIINPGRLLPSKKIDRLIGTTPESRNEILAGAFRRYNICEERGSGFQKVIKSIELFGLPPIHFEEGEDYFKVTLYAPKAYNDMSIDERIEACYQHAIIQYLSNKTMTNTSLRERFKMNEKRRVAVSKLINSAVEKGVIKPKDPNNPSSKFAEYQPYWV